MSHELHLILNVTVAVAIALVGGLLAHAARQPAIIGYLLAGVVIGPFTPGFIGDRSAITGLAEVGVIFLMFALGIEFSLKELARVQRVALLGTAGQVLLTIAAGLGIGAFLGWPLGQGLFFGGVIAIASTMVILKTLIERGEVTRLHGRVLLGMLIVQDLVVVVLIVILPKLVAGAETVFVDLAFTLGKAILFVATTLFLGARVVPRLMAHVERLGSSELFLLTAVSLALGTATVSGLLGLSPALGAFLGGLLLTETEFDHRVIAEVVPMRNVFATLFFVSVGMLIDPGFILNNLPAVLIGGLVIMLVKAVATFAVIAPFGLGSRVLAFSSLGMIQIGEFSYVLAQAGVTSGAISDELHSLILAWSVLTIVLTPAAFWIAPRVERLLHGFGLDSHSIGKAQILEDLTGHAVIIGYGRVGGRVAAGLKDAGLPLVVIDQDLHVVQSLSRTGTTAFYGDASFPGIVAASHPERASLVVLALPDVATTRAVIRQIRALSRTVPILARVGREEEAEDLLRQGATLTVPPEQAGAELLLQGVFEILGAAPAKPEVSPAPVG